MKQIKGNKRSYAALSKALATALSLGSLLGSSIATQAAPLDLDMSFSSDGIVQENFAANSSGNSFYHDVAVTPAGKMVTVGHAQNTLGSYDLIVAQYNANGGLDTSFGNQGKYVYSALDSRGTAVVVQADGKIVVAGVNRTSDTAEWRLAVTRLNADGSLDTSFADQGVFVTQYDNPYGYRSGPSGRPAKGNHTAEDLALDSKGNILILARHYTGRTLNLYRYAGHLIRLNTDGVIDTNFGSNGRALLAYTVNEGRDFYKIALDANDNMYVPGKRSIIAAYTAPQTMRLEKYNADGSAGSFTTQHYWNRNHNPTILNDVLYGSVVLPDGNIFSVGCTSSGSSYTIKHNPSGGLVAAYNTNGTQSFNKLTTSGGGNECLRDVVYHPSVGVVAVGNDDVEQMALAVNGTTGAEIGSTKLAALSTGVLKSLTVLPTGQIAAVGYSRINSSSPYTANIVMMQGAALPAATVSTNALIFNHQTNVNIDAAITQQANNNLALTGATTIDAHVLNGEVSANSSTAFQAGALSNGDVIELSHTSSDKGQTEKKTMLVLETGTSFSGNNKSWKSGDTISEFISTTKVADITPDAFNLQPQGLAPAPMPNTVQYSETITVSGLDVPVDISINSGNSNEYSVNGGTYRSTASQVESGDTVRVRHNTGADYSTTVTSSLTIGDTTGTFNTTTVAEDTIPNAFALPVRTGVIKDSYFEWSVRIRGINAPAPISVTNGEYRIVGVHNSTTYVTTAGQISNDYTVFVRQRTASTGGTTTTTTLTVGGVSANLVTTTIVDDTTPNSFDLGVDATGAQLNEVFDNMSVTVAGINTATSISITDGEYSINNGGFTSAAGTVDNGDVVTVKHTASNAYSTTVTTSLNIGGVVDTFESTTIADPNASNSSSGSNSNGGNTPDNNSSGGNSSSGSSSPNGSSSSGSSSSSSSSGGGHMQWAWLLLLAGLIRRKQ